LGLEHASRFVVVGALATGIVDSGGPYGQRLRAMVANALISPFALMLGAACGAHWWLAALAMVLVAALGGMMRGLGPSAAPLGVTHAVAFLIGTQLPELHASGPEMAGAYAAGGVWTILVSIIIWRARPYRRLEQEVASVWEEVAALLATIQATAEREGMPARLERSLAARQRSTRETIERARILLDEARGRLSEQSASIDALLVLLRAASRITTVAAALADLVVRDGARRQPEDLVKAIDAIERASRAVAFLLSHGRGEIPVERCREAVAALYAEAAQTEGSPRVARRRIAPLGLALRHIENAQDAAEALFGTKQRFRGLLPPLGLMPPWRASLRALGAHFTFRSLILRHALRVALCTGLATAIMLKLQIPHGIWLPLTALVVSQPEFGGTMRRAFERSVGTIGGAVLGAALLALLKGTYVLDVAIVALGFGAFLLLRRRYGYAMVFITPMVILLLGFSEPDPWIDIRDRVIDTVLGAALALMAAYALWPQWESERLSVRISSALNANAAYLR